MLVALEWGAGRFCAFVGMGMLYNLSVLQYMVVPVGRLVIKQRQHQRNGDKNNAFEYSFAENHFP